MATERQETIASLMTGLSKREFTGFEIALIERAIVKEAGERNKKGIKINTRTKKGRDFISNRTAELVNEILVSKVKITVEHIRIYKTCRVDEFSERTGRCAWGFKDLRKRLGYDPYTGKEI